MRIRFIRSNIFLSSLISMRLVKNNNTEFVRWRELQTADRSRTDQENSYTLFKKNQSVFQGLYWLSFLHRSSFDWRPICAFYSESSLSSSPFNQWQLRMHIHLCNTLRWKRTTCNDQLLMISSFEEKKKTRSVDVVQGHSNCRKFTEK